MEWKINYHEPQTTFDTGIFQSKHLRQKDDLHYIQLT